MHGKDNDLVERVKADPYFEPILGHLEHILDAKTFTGRAEEQVDEFIDEEVNPILDRYTECLKNLQIVHLTI